MQTLNKYILIHSRSSRKHFSRYSGIDLILLRGCELFCDIVQTEPCVPDFSTICGEVYMASARVLYIEDKPDNRMLVRRVLMGLP